MRKSSFKFIAAGILLAGAMLYLLVAGLKAGSVYSVSVDRFLTDAEFQSGRVRLHGKVGADHFQSSPGKLCAQFDLMGKEHAIGVVYNGVIPDLFKTGCDVVIEGTRDANGVFQSDLMMTKCASKYEPGSPHAALPDSQRPGARS